MWYVIIRKFGDLRANTDWWTFNLMKSANYDIQGKGTRDLAIILFLHLALRTVGDSAHHAAGIIGKR